MFVSLIFASLGIEYSLGRIPMASCDFSTHSYSYDDVKNDFELTYFSLAMEDTKYKVNIDDTNGGNHHSLGTA